MFTITMIHVALLLSVMPLFAAIPVIALKMKKTNFTGLINLCNRLIAGLTGNSSLPVPNPTITALETAVSDLQTSVTKFGSKGNRGSHADYLDLKAKAITVYMLIKAEADYVSNTAVTAAGNDLVAMAEIMSSSGLTLKKTPVKQGTLQQVRNLRVVVSPEVNYNQQKIDWRQPLNVSSNSNVKSYRVMFASTPDFSTAAEIDVVTKTEYIYTNTTASFQTGYIFILAVGAAGDGVVSAPLKVLVPGA